MDYLKVNDLTFYYGQEPVLQNVSYRIAAGEFVILTGENGAAKSTLLKCSLGILHPAKGKIVRSKINNAGKPLVTGYIPQQISSFNAGFPSTVLELVASGRYPRGHWFKRLDEDDLEIVRAALEALDVWELRKRRIGELSGGQKQRISLARILATDPDLYVLDEPTTGMDEASRNRLYQLLKKKTVEEDKAVLMVTHDHEDGLSWADRHLHLVRKEGVEWRSFHMTSCKELS